MGAAQPCCCTEDASAVEYSTAAAVKGREPVLSPVDGAVVPLPTSEGDEGGGCSQFSRKAADLFSMTVSITSYLRHAVEGRQVHLIMVANLGEKQPSVLREEAVLCLSRHLRDLRIQVDRSRLTFPVQVVQDVYSIEGDGEQAFPQQLLETLSQEERDRLVRIAFRPVGEEPREFTLLEASPGSRKSLELVLKILQEHTAVKVLMHGGKAERRGHEAPEGGETWLQEGLTRIDEEHDGRE